MILKPLGQNYLKSSLGQAIQRRSLGRSLSPLGSSQLPYIPNLEGDEGMGEFSYSPRSEWNIGNTEQPLTPSIQASQDDFVSTPRSLDENILLNNNNSSDNITRKVQRSPLNSTSFPITQTTNANLVSEGNEISEITIPEIQRSLVNLSPQTTDKDIIPNNDNITDIESPEVQRSLEDKPLSELPGYQDTYSEDNIRSRPKFSLSQFASNTIDNTFPIARKIIQRVNEINSPQSSDLSSSESIQPQSKSLEIETSEVQRSPLESTSQATDENIVSDSTNIAETTTSEIQRSPLESSSLSTSQTRRENIVSDRNNITETPTPEVQRSPLETPSLSPPQIRNDDIVSDSTNIAKTPTPEVQRSPLESSSLSTPQTRRENIVSDRNNITETPTPEVQRSPLETPSLSPPQIRNDDIVSDSTNIAETTTSEVQRSLEDKKLSKLPGYQDTYLEDTVRSRPKFSLSEFASNAIENTFPIARKVIQRVNEIASPKSSNLDSSEIVRFKEESLEVNNPAVQRSPLESSSLSTPQTRRENIVSDRNNITETSTPKIQRSPLESSSLSTSQTRSENIVSDRNNITETPTPEIQRSPLESSSLSTPQTRSENIVSDRNNITETPTPEIQRSPLESSSLSTPQTRSENIVSDRNNIIETSTPEIQRSPLESSSLSTPQTRSENIVSDRNNITETPTPEIQRSPTEIPPSVSQPDTAIAAEESQVTTLSEGRGFLQLQPLGQPQPLRRNSDYYPSSFVSTSLKEMLDYSGENNVASVQKKEEIVNKTSTSISNSKTLDFPQSWSNVSELIGDSPNTIDTKKTEDWGGFSGLMEDTSLLPESPPTPASEAIVQAKNAPVEGELMIPMTFEEIVQEGDLALPPTPQPQKQELEQPIADEELELLAQLVYRLVRSRLNIERERQYNQLGDASFWPDTVYFARDEHSSLASSEMLVMLKTLNPYTSDRLSILAREVYVLLQMRIECDRDRQGIYY